MIKSYTENGKTKVEINGNNKEILCELMLICQCVRELYGRDEKTNFDEVLAAIMKED